MIFIEPEPLQTTKSVDEIVRVSEDKTCKILGLLVNLCFALCSKVTRTPNYTFSTFPGPMTGEADPPTVSLDKSTPGADS
jgi:hypothetical protein